MLPWTWTYKYLFKYLFSVILDIYPEVELLNHQFSSVQFSPVTQSRLTLCNPMDCSTPGFPVLHQLPELAQTHIPEVGMPSNHLILCCPLLLLLSIFPSIRVFSDKSVLHIRWPKYWSFNFNISPSMNIQDWFLLQLTGLISLQYRELSRVFSNTTV